jgi:hypothetical protein
LLEFGEQYGLWPNSALIYWRWNVQKAFSASLLPLCFLCVLGLFGCSSNGQSLITNLPGEQPAAQPATQPTEHANGIVQDWSMRYLVYPQIGEINSLIALQNDPRAILSWQEAERQRFNRLRAPRHFFGQHTHQDWSISLGTGGMAPAMFPAKFTFDTSAAPTCTAVSPAVPDFIVYTVNAVSSSSQPNIVAFDNLYSGTAGSTGICNRTPLFGVDDGISATTIWSYNIKAAGGQVATSPALSLDGTKVAFVETGAGTTAHFHVLAWKSGDGVAANLQTVTSPKSITSGFDASAPTAGSGNVTDLALGSSSDTLSSPFIDYADDLAYVGNDAGQLFRIKFVFCTTSACTGAGSPQPTLDNTWGSSGALTTGCPGKLTGPVADRHSGNIFVGCSDGKLYGFSTFTGTAITGSPLTVGNGGADGGIVDPPMIDTVRGFAYVVSGASGVAGPQVLVQASTSNLSSNSTATLAAGGSFNVHAPAFNDAYFSSGTSSQWLLFEVTGDSVANRLTEYGITFNGSHVMTSGPPTNSHQFPAAAFEVSPMTTFLTTGGEDRLFESALGAFSGNIISLNISSGAFPTVPETFTTEGSGTTGIVVDNASASAQADSIYFGVLASNTAVKLTQSTFQ